jgi:ribosome-binding protein aMBF1 (putative translation factor)
MNVGVVSATPSWYHGGMDAAELIHRRTALGLSRRELAREIGVDHVTVWRWEVQERTPTAIIRREVERTLKRLERTRARRPSAGADET